MVKAECKNCHKYFDVLVAEINREGGKFCSRECSISYHRGQNATNWKGGNAKVKCLLCNKEFLASRSRMNSGGGKFCSTKCAGEYYRGPRSQHWRGGEIERHCTFCGATFFVRRYKVKDNYGKFCSRECMGKYNSEHFSGKNSFNYKGENVKRVEMVCKFCGNAYLVYPSEVKRSKFCSRHCLNLHNFLNAPKKETGIERTVRSWLEEYCVEYIPQKLLFRTTFADFFIEPNKAIYCDGSYWHSKPYAKNKDVFVNKLLKEKGYLLLRLGEEEIENRSAKPKLLEFLGTNTK
jgi:very-short-patch-repair endonuclease